MIIIDNMENLSLGCGINKKSGFSAISVAIMLFIISLITGGIYFGQNLIDNNKRNNIFTEYTKYKASVNMYSSEYRFLPGDHPTADEWLAGIASNEVGNGDSTICCKDTTTANGSAEVNESFLFWYHLSQSGYIDGEMSGQSNAATIVGEDVPSFHDISGAGWWVFFSGKLDTGWNLSDKIYGYEGNVIGLGKNSEDYLDGGVVDAEFTRTIDKKFDDALPATGVMFAIRSIAGNGSVDTGCVNQNPDYQDTDVSYDFTTEDKLCRLVFRLK